MILNQLGGAEWLRALLDKKAPMPKKYYEVFNKSRATKTFESRTTDGVVAIRKT
jgi:hypothetical protein